jgi:hypothetical protein
MILSLNFMIFSESFIIFEPWEILKQNREIIFRKIKFSDWSIEPLGCNLREEITKEYKWGMLKKDELKSRLTKARHVVNFYRPKHDTWRHIIKWVPHIINKNYRSWTHKCHMAAPKRCHAIVHVLVRNIMIISY